MINENCIIVELVNMIDVVCAQVATMVAITGRQFSQEKMQALLDTRVEEFKQLYIEIPKNAKFTIDNTIDGVVFISSNEVFRDYANEITEQSQLANELANVDFLSSALH